MQIFKNPGVLFCSSAFLLVLGAYLATMEVPVRITYDPTAAEQYDLMRAYIPFGFALWILALLFLSYGIALGVRKPLAIGQLRKPFCGISLIVAVTLGFLAFTSTFLPWVIAERTEPSIETRGGTFNVGQYHALTGVSLMTGTNNMEGDVLSLVFVGAIIAILHIPLLTLLEKERTDAMRAFLFLLSGICVINAAASIYTHRIWWVGFYFGEGSGVFSVTFKSPGIGLLIATVSAAGLIAYGLLAAIKLAQQHMRVRTNYADAPFNSFERAF